MGGQVLLKEVVFNLKRMRKSFVSKNWGGEGESFAGKANSMCITLRGESLCVPDVE